MDIEEGARLQEARLQEQKMLCRQKMIAFPTPDGHCPIVWDTILCWPATAFGTTARLKCPKYIYGFNHHAYATRLCTDAGYWWVNPAWNDSWTDYGPCSKEYVPSHNVTLIGSHVSVIKTISTISKVGYSVSLVSLVAAFLILASIRKLRCPRNNLHMQLFVSFILRAAMTLLKSALFVDSLGFHSNLELLPSGAPAFSDAPENNVGCKIFTSLWHYFLMANYSWILMEGLYLHNLIFMALFTDTSGIARYVLMGWGLPVCFIVPWVVVRALYEDTLCWTTYDIAAHFWIIRGPISASIVVNFIIFINITRVLFVKMFQSQAALARTYKYRKWFKSTLVLVPLYGVHYALLLAMPPVASVYPAMELFWLYVDQFFSSFQGFVVSLLYCFFNGEVQGELHKIWLKYVDTKVRRGGGDCRCGSPSVYTTSQGGGPTSTRPSPERLPLARHPSNGLVVTQQPPAVDSVML